MVVSLPTRRRTRVTRAIALTMSLALGASTAAAEARRLVVLQRGGGDVDDALRGEVDRLVLQTATADAGYQHAFASPVPLEDVELAAGCSAREDGCLQRIASTLGADTLMLRDLSRGADGKVQLALTVHDGKKDAPARRAVSVLPAELDGTDQVVPRLLEQLFPEVRKQREERPRIGRRLDLHTPSGIVGVASLGVATTLLAGGIATAISWRRAQNDYDSAPAGDHDGVDRLHEHLDQARRRARIANGLFIASGSLAAIGVSSLLYGYLRGRSTEKRSVELAAVPMHDGVALSLHGAWRGGI